MWGIPEIDNNQKATLKQFAMLSNVNILLTLLKVFINFKTRFNANVRYLLLKDSHFVC